MEQIPEKKKIYESLNIMWTLAIGITFTLLATFLAWDKYINLMRSDIHLFILSALLAALTLGLFFAYAIATRHELNLLNYYIGEDYFTIVGPKTYLIGFALALLFSVLIALSTNLIAYSIVMVSYNLFDLWANWTVAENIGPAIEKKLHEEQNEELRQPIHVLKSFYFDNPTIPRIVTIMFVNWIVICLALSYYFTGNELLRNCGYIILLINIASGEIVVHYWRWRSIYKLKQNT